MYIHIDNKPDKCVCVLWLELTSSEFWCRKCNAWVVVGCVRDPPIFAYKCPNCNFIMFSEKVLI